MQLKHNPALNRDAAKHRTPWLFRVRRALAPREATTMSGPIMRNIGLAILSLFLVCCSTVPNVSPPPIAVPSGLTENDVELAVLMAVSDRPVPPTLTPGQQITDNVLSAVIGRYDSVRMPRQYWYFEAREPRTVYAGYQYHQVYMRVAVRYDARNVTMTIVESRNLKQDENSIHKGAFAYLQTLEGRVRRTLGSIARRNLGGA